MAKLKDIVTLKQRVAKAKAAKNRAEGRMQQIEERLQKEFGCSSIEEAEQKLKELKKNVEETGQDYDDKCKRFRRKNRELYDELVGTADGD